jgi:hypothetical protein
MAWYRQKSIHGWEDLARSSGKHRIKGMSFNVGITSSDMAKQQVRERLAKMDS